MSSVTPIRVGVIGTGVMGGHHTRVAATVPGCQLMGIYDANYARAEEIAREYGTAAHQTLDGICATVDAVIVATPTVTHAEVASACLLAGCHVLLEKPMAASVPEAEALLAIARSSGRTLMIGHVERYNPAVTAALSTLPVQDLFALDVHRLSPAPGRDRSADIILDLMIHDIDLALAFTQAPVVGLSALGHSVRGDLIDHVTALIHFGGGITATLTASSVSQERIRHARLFTRTSLIEVDFAGRAVSIHRQGQSTIANTDGRYYNTSQVEQILVPNREPLAVEQEHFLAAIRHASEPLTSAEAGLQALQLAYAIQSCVRAQMEHGQMSCQQVLSASEWGVPVASPAEP